MRRNKIKQYTLTRLGSARLLARAGHFLLLTLITLSASNIQFSQAQSVPQNTREDAMIADMLNAVKTEQPLDKLFDENRELITADLWKKITKRALSDYYSVGSDQSIRLYRLAFNIAQRLKDKRLIAVSHYNLGRTFSSLSQTEAAIASYQESWKAFESVGLRRDAIYILGDLAALYYYGDKYNLNRSRQHWHTRCSPLSSLEF